MTTRVHFLSLVVWLLRVPQLQGFRPPVHTQAAALVGSRHRTTPVPAAATTWRLPPRHNPSTQRQASLSSNNNEAAVPVGSPPTTRAFVWYLPPSLSVMAYCLYDDTSSAFHKLLDWASGNTWVPADGGKYISEITRNALTGPVTFSVSILFGSLVGLTISTLHGRQMSLQRLFVTLHEDGKEMEALLKSFPASDPAIALLTHFMMRIDTSLQVPTKSTEAALRKNTELAQLTAWLHGIDESTVNGTILAETYATLTRLKATRIELWAAYIRKFSVAHYTNMIILASALLFIFLLETDNGTMQYLIDFQLSICWALLVGAYSLLAAVILDMRGVPPQLSTRLDQEAVVVEDD